MVELHNARGRIRRRPSYWLRPQNLLAARRRLRADRSNEWRYSFSSAAVRTNAARSMPFTTLLPPGRSAERFRFLVLADTGEGDLSQWALVPLIRELAPDFLVLNGDVAYPAGRPRDFQRGFFEPYAGLGIPVWAVPGNHEYYSRSQGEVFFETFCTFHRAGDWQRAGLRFEPQPGTYWELRQPEGPLAVLALDSGKKGHLDGRRSHGEDAAQHRWLEGRLRAAEAQGAKAIALFHIPGLVRQTHDGATHLRQLHRILASSPAVKLVLCGHVHNYQLYSPATFESYLAGQHQAQSAAPPHYVVCGAGGAYMSSTVFRSDRYPASDVFPSERQYVEASGTARFFNDVLRLGRTPVGRVVSAFADRDEAQFLSFLQVDVDGGRVSVQPVFLEDYRDLYPGLPSGTVVRVDQPNPPEVAAGLAAVRKTWPAPFRL